MSDAQVCSAVRLDGVESLLQEMAADGQAHSRPRCRTYHVDWQSTFLDCGFGVSCRDGHMDSLGRGTQTAIER